MRRRPRTDLESLGRFDFTGDARPRNQRSADIRYSSLAQAGQKEIERCACEFGVQLVMKVEVHVGEILWDGFGDFVIWKLDLGKALFIVVMVVLFVI